MSDRKLNTISGPESFRVIAIFVSVTVKVKHIGHNFLMSLSGCQFLNCPYFKGAAFEVVLVGPEGWYSLSPRC